MFVTYFPVYVSQHKCLYTILNTFTNIKQNLATFLTSYYRINFVNSNIRLVVTILTYKAIDFVNSNIRLFVTLNHHSKKYFCRLYHSITCYISIILFAILCKKIKLVLYEIYISTITFYHLL